MNDNKFIIGIGDGEHQYTVNGVKYIVSSRFKKFDFNNIKDTLTERIEKYIKNDIAHLTDNLSGSKIDAECVSTAGKEV